MAGLTSKIQKVTDDMAVVSANQHRQLAGRFQIIMSDLQAIDALVDQVIKVLAAKLPPVD
ncbi:MAG: hypothetical protein IIB37_14950 [Gemmatimonadetes bacterium]|nr:hypothetical protein [Gemmatimonadota bacterium]